MKQFSLLASSILLATASATSHAELVYYNFNGTVVDYSYDSHFGSDPFGGAINTGDQFSGSLSYEATEAYLYSSHTGNDFYQLTKGTAPRTNLTNITGSVNGLTFNNLPLALGAAWVYDNSYPLGSGSGDYLRLNVGNAEWDKSVNFFPELPGVPSYYNGAEYYTKSGSLTYYDPTGTMLSSTALPGSPPDVTDAIGFFTWTASVAYVDSYGNDTYYDLYSIKVSMNPVPVPGAAWLFGSALLGLVGAGRQRA